MRKFGGGIGDDEEEKVTVTGEDKESSTMDEIKSRLSRKRKGGRKQKKSRKGRKSRRHRKSRR